MTAAFVTEATGVQNDSEGQRKQVYCEGFRDTGSSLEARDTGGQSGKQQKRRSRRRKEGSGRQQVATIRLTELHQEGFHSTDGPRPFLLEVQPRIDRAWILVKQTLTLVELINSTLTY